MCIRDSLGAALARDEIIDHARLQRTGAEQRDQRNDVLEACLLYTSDAADERSSVDLGGRRIIKKKKEIRSSDTDKDKRKSEQI